MSDLREYLDIALALHERGLHPFPCDHPDQPVCIGKHGPDTPCDGTRGKHPAVKFGTWAVAAPEQMMCQEWERRGGLANVGIACGPANLVILDEDELGEMDRWCADHGITLPPTHVVTTGRGRHFYFRWDHAVARIGNREKAFRGYKINVRGDGGYVIGAGSVHESGAIYTGNGQPIGPLPEQLADILRYAVGGTNGVEVGSTATFWEPPRNPNRDKVSFGERHTKLVEYAGRLRKLGLDYDEAVPTYRARWLLCEQPEGQIPDAAHHSAACRYPVTWDDAQQKLTSVYSLYPPGEVPTDAAASLQAEPSGGTWQFVDGASFILDIPSTIPALWGEGQDVLWARGESLMIAGPMGLGKTTLLLRLLRARLGLGDDSLLGYPIAPCEGTILFLAMDRPDQIARAAYRMFDETERAILRDRVKFWKGPPPADVARQPGILTALAEIAGAAEVYLDSVKDAAIGLSEDEVGAGYNRARQTLLATGRQLAESHHTVKRGPHGKPPTDVADIYGSAWITNGTGSIILLTGEPGDPIVGLRHVRQPANEIGPLRLLHDQDAGLVTVHDRTDLVALAAASGANGLTAKCAAVALFSAKPTPADVEKARRKLMKLTSAGLLKMVEGEPAKPGEYAPRAWFASP